MQAQSWGFTVGGKGDACAAHEPPTDGHAGGELVGVYAERMVTEGVTRAIWLESDVKSGYGDALALLTSETRP